MLETRSSVAFILGPIQQGLELADNWVDRGGEEERKREGEEEGEGKGKGRCF